MSSPRTRRRPILDELEGRLVLSATPSNALGVANGVVSAPGAAAQVSIPVSAFNINGRHSIVIGETITPAPGSALQPRAVSVTGADGQPLQVEHGAPFVAGVHGSDTIFVRVGTPGPVTTVVTGKNGTTGAFQLQAYLRGDVLGTGQVSLADLKAFTKSFLTTSNDALYNPLADANRNGQIGATDGRELVRNLTPLTPKRPMYLQLTLSTQDETKGQTLKNSGGVTAKKTVTIYGHTVPGSIVFTDNSSGDYSFAGPALATDAHGNFSITVSNREGLNNYDFKAVSPYGQQLIQDYPIVWTAFAAPGSKL